METPVSGAGRKTMGARKGSKIAEHLQNYLDEVDDGWDEDFMLRPSDTHQEPASLDLGDLLDDMNEDTFGFALDTDLGLLDDSDKESDDSDFDDEDWDAQLDMEPAARVTLSVGALLDQPADAEPAKLELSFLGFLKNPTPHEFTTPLLRHLPQPPVSFSTLLDIARESPPSPVPDLPLASPARVREAPAESNVASTVIAKLSGFAQQVEFAPFELSREVVATVEPPLIRRSIALAQSHAEQQEYDDGLNRMEALMNIFYQYMRSHECYTCWMLNNTDPADVANTRADLECMTKLCIDLCRYWLEELKSEIVGPKFDRAVAQYLRSCHLHVRMLEINNYLHSVSKTLGLGSGNTSSQLEMLFMEVESIGGFPDVLLRARNELMAIIIADVLLCRSNILPLTGVSTQPSTPHDNDTPDYQGGVLSRINSLRSLDDLESEADHTPTRDQRRSSDGMQTDLKKPLTTCLTLLQSNKLPAHVRSKLCFAMSSYVSGVWANEQDCIDDAEMDQLLVKCQAVDEKQIIESLLYETVLTLFEGESGANAVRSPANIAHSDALVKTLPNFASVFSYHSMRTLADCWVKTKPFFALYIFPVCISMLHKQNKPIERRTLQKELAILSANHKDTERAIVHCESVLEDARALGELSEVVFVTDLLVSQHCDQGAFEEAIRVLQQTLAFLNASDKQPNGAARTGQKVQLQMHTDSVHARLAHVYLLSGSPEIAAIEFERLFKSLENRPEGSAVINKKVAILSWVAKAHLKANNLEESRKALARIRQLRKRTGGTSALRASAGILNATHIWWGFRADALESCLPKYCVSGHNADLGALHARLQYRFGKHVEALKQLVHTIIAVELAVGDKTGPQDGVVELGRLYELRGKIQLAAAASSAHTTFPFSLGGEQLFASILSAYETEFSRKSAKKSSARIGVDVDVPRGNANSTCRKSKRYKGSNDLLWDAMKWFKRAWECFKAGGEKIRAARAASGLVKVYLQAVYVPASILKTQPLAGWGPVTQLSVRRVPSASTDSNQVDMVSSPTSPRQSHASSEAEGRRPQLQEARAALDYLKHVAHDTFMPLLIIETYLHMAELHHVEDETEDALECWKHARDAFMLLFVDGVQIPILRVASIPWVRRIDSVVTRLVRFLWSCDREFMNENLLLLDMYTIFTMERDRAFRRGAALARETRRISDGTNLILNVATTPRSHGDIQEQPLASPAKPAPVRRRSLHQHVEPPPVPEITHNQVPETFAASPLEPLFYYSNAVEKADHVRISRRDGTRHLKGDSGEPLKDAKSSLANLFAPPSSPLRITAKTIPAAASTGVDTGSPKKASPLLPSDSTSSSSRPSSTNRSSRMFSPVDLHTETQMALHYPWSVDRSYEARTMTNELEDTLLKNSWRCCTLMDKTTQTYHTQGGKFERFQESMRQLVRVMTVIMKRARRLTQQYTLEELAYDRVLDTASQLSHGVDSEAITVYERLQRLVYVIQVDDLLLFYHPQSGRRHVEQLAQVPEQVPAQEIVPPTPLDREASTDELTDATGRENASHRKTVSAVSQLTSTTQRDRNAPPQAPARSLLPLDMGKLLVDYAIVINENACGGGSGERSAKLLRTEADTFRSLGRFIRAVAMFDDKEKEGGDENDHVSTDQPRPRRRQSSSGLSSSRIRTQLRAFFHGKRTEKSAPTIPSPVTLVCSKNAHALPWEALFPEIVLVRSLCLLSLHAGPATGIYGPCKHTHPEYFGICQGLSHLPGRVQQEIRVRDLHRRIWSSVRVLRKLKHPTESIINANAAVINTQLPRLQLSSNPELAVTHQAVANQCDDQAWPVPSPFLPFGKNTPQSTRSTRLKRVHYFDIMKGVNASPTSLVGWLDNHIVPAKSFPLLFLTYSDLNELPDAVLYLLATRKDTVVIFIPHYCAALVAKEITSAVDKWCLDQTTPSSTKPQPTMQFNLTATGGSEANIDFDSEVPPVSESPTAHHRHVIPSGDTRSDYSGTGRLRVYDAVMDTVIRFIEQQAAPIVVFNL